MVNFGCFLILKIKELIVFVEMRFQLLSGVIGYIDSEYDSVNNIQLIFDVVYEKE